MHVKVLLKYTKQENITSEDIQAWVSKHTWTRLKTFNLVSHGNEGRPCITVGNPVPGKPCSFPFVYPDCSVFPTTKACFSTEIAQPLPRYECITEGGFSWCSTRTHWNNSHITGEYGTCSPHCKDSKNSTKNLVNIEFQSLWEEGYYRLFNDGVGQCHTYNPVHRSSTLPDEKLIMLLGKPWPKNSNMQYET